MNQKSRNDPYSIIPNTQTRQPSVSLISNDEFYGNQYKSQLGENNKYDDKQQIGQQNDQYNKNSQRQINFIDDSKIKGNRINTLDIFNRFLMGIQLLFFLVEQQEQQEELEKAFNILDLQKRDINMLTQKITSLAASDKRFDELNQQLIEKDKQIKGLEHEKNYFNKVLGNVDKIMKIEGQKDQKIQQIHQANKEEVRILKDRIRELETIQRQSEKNAMKLHQHYLDLEEKYKQSLQSSQIPQNKSPNRIRGSQLVGDLPSNQYLESIKSDYEDKLQTLIQKLKDKENENKSLYQSLQSKQNEINDLKVQVKEYQIQIQREQRDKEMIESYNKNLRDQLKIQAQKLSQETIPTVPYLGQQGREIIKIPGSKSRMATPKKDAQSPFVSGSSTKRETQSNSNSLEKINNSFNKGQQNNNKNGIQIYKRQESTSTKRGQNKYNNHTASMDIQHSRDDFLAENSNRMHSSVLNENNAKYSTPTTPQKKQIVKRQLRSTTVNNDQITDKQINKSVDRRETILSNNNSNIFSTNNTNSNRTAKKSGLYQSKIIVRESDDLINQLQPLSARNRVNPQGKLDKLNKNSIENVTPPMKKSDQNVLIETPYVRTLNNRYLALKNNQSDVKSTLQTELSTLLERKQKKQYDQNKSPDIKTNSDLNKEQDKLKSNNNLTGQYPSDASEYDLNVISSPLSLYNYQIYYYQKHTFTQFQREVSQLGLQRLIQDEEENGFSPKRTFLYPGDDEKGAIKSFSNDSNRANSQTPNVNQNRSKWEPVKIKLLSIGKVQPHNQIMFSDKEYITSQNPINIVTTRKIVGGRFWIFKPTNKIMGLQIKYLTNQNKVVWGPANVHIFTANILIQSFNLAQNFQEEESGSKLDYVSIIGCRYNQEYSYVENLTFISNEGIVFNFGKPNLESKSQMSYFDIDTLKEAPFSVFGAISKEYDPMSGNLIGTKLSYFGCHVINLENKIYSKENTPINSDQNLQNRDNLSNTNLLTPISLKYNSDNKKSNQSQDNQQNIIIPNNQLQNQENNINDKNENLAPVQQTQQINDQQNKQLQTSIKQDELNQQNKAMSPITQGTQGDKLNNNNLDEKNTQIQKINQPQVNQSENSNTSNLKQNPQQENLTSNKNQEQKPLINIQEVMMSEKQK